MQRNLYSPEFIEQALLKARARGRRTLQSVAIELNISLGTLKGWLKRSSYGQAGMAHAPSLPDDLASTHWTAAQRLVALNESHALEGPALHAWCREKGLFEHQLLQWRESFCTAPHSTVASASEQRLASTALRDLQGRHDKLQREMLRKDRALAEAAALLVLQKKFQDLVLQQSQGEDK